MIPFFDPMRRAERKLHALLRDADTLQVERQILSVADLRTETYVIRIHRFDGPLLFVQELTLRSALHKMLDTLKK